MMYVIGGKWNTFYFVQQGNWVESHLSECPITASCLRQLPVLAGNTIGFCYFSILQPGTHIQSHHGATNLKLRAQFALQVPCTVSNNNHEVLLTQL
jgi:aspartyl/asparaginyl beta-hydroxylase (cupin superfamily)